jgi:hypothetical protein
MNEVTCLGFRHFEQNIWGRKKQKGEEEEEEEEEEEIKKDRNQQ